MGKNTPSHRTTASRMRFKMRNLCRTCAEPLRNLSGSHLYLMNNNFPMHLAQVSSMDRHRMYSDPWKIRFNTGSTLSVMRSANQTPEYLLARVIISSMSRPCLVNRFRDCTRSDSGSFIYPAGLPTKAVLGSMPRGRSDGDWTPALENSPAFDPPAVLRSDNRPSSDLAFQ